MRVNCSKAEIAENTYVTCDNCQSRCCLEYSGLAASEVKVVVLKSRILEYFCEGYDAKHQKSVDMVISCETKDDKADEVRFLFSSE